MARRVKLQLGFAGEQREVTVLVPDDELTPWQWGERLKMVGTTQPRVDGPLKATGRARYTFDVSLPGMLYGAILRSPYPHARIRSVDLTSAGRLLGVRAAITADSSEVRFAGEEVAAVAAVSPEVAADALELIRVDYEELPFVVDMESALKPSAPPVFRRGNVAKPMTFSKGDVQRGFAGAAAVHEAVYTTPVQTHVSLETHGAVASWEGDRLTVWSSTQGIFSVRDDLAVYFSLPPENVRVITQYLGGGFGSKLGAGVHNVLAARLAREAGAPVKLMLPRRDEHLATGNRPSSWQRFKLGAGRDGRLTAIELVQHGSGGIGGGAGSSGPARMLYRCPNIRTEERNVFINAGPSSPMRAPGWPQGCFGLELAIDELARKLGIDRLEFRRRNCADPVRTLEFDLGARAFRWQEKSQAPRSSGPLKRGIGVASAQWHGIGASGPQAQALAFRDGHAEVRIGTQDIGTGTRTAIAMVAAEELGLPLERVRVEIGDTRYLFSLPSGGSLTVPSTTPAVRQAAAGLKQKLMRIAAPMLAAEPGDLEARDGQIRVRFDPSRAVAFSQVCRRLPADSVSAQGERVMNYAGFQDHQAGCQFAEVEVDAEIGMVRVLKVVAVHDAGRIVDPLTARSQVNGGVLMGVGFALFEERRIDPRLGEMVNPTMDDYKLCGALDVPEIVAIFVEVANGMTNTGALGLGEVVHVATAAAIACAVYDAVGHPVRALPMTPDKVLAAIEARA